MKKVASAIVSGNGFRIPAAQDERRRFAVEIAKYCRQQNAEIVLLPAGYLLAKDNTRDAARREAENLAQSFMGMSLCAGIDLRDAEKLGDSKTNGYKLLDHWTRKGMLPFWTFASDSAGSVLDMFRQRSTSSGNAGQMPNPPVTAKQNRMLHIAGLHCYLSRVASYSTRISVGSWVVSKGWVSLPTWAMLVLAGHSQRHFRISRAQQVPGSSTRSTQARHGVGQRAPIGRRSRLQAP